MAVNTTGLAAIAFPNTITTGDSSFPIILENEVRGGLQYVAGTTGDERTDITPQRLQYGMLVYDDSDNTYYQYTNTTARNSMGELPNTASDWTAVRFAGMPRIGKAIEQLGHLEVETSDYYWPIETDHNESGLNGWTYTEPTTGRTPSSPIPAVATIAAQSGQFTNATGEDQIVRRVDIDLEVTRLPDDGDTNPRIFILYLDNSTSTWSIVDSTELGTAIDSFGLHTITDMFMADLNVANNDRIGIVIRDEQALDRPFGINITGVRFSPDTAAWLAPVHPDAFNTDLHVEGDELVLRSEGQIIPNSGVITDVPDYPATGGIALEFFGSVEETITQANIAVNDWPTGTPDLYGATTGITYNATTGRLTNNTGSDIDLSNARLDVELDILLLSTSTAFISVTVHTPGDSTASGTFFQTAGSATMGRQTLSDTAIGAQNVWVNGEDLVFDLSYLDLTTGNSIVASIDRLQISYSQTRFQRGTNGLSIPNRLTAEGRSIHLNRDDVTIDAVDIAEPVGRTLEAGNNITITRNHDNTVIAATGANVASINDIGDVTVTTPANDQVLTYDSATSMWTNQDASSGGISQFAANTPYQMNDIVWNGTDIYRARATFTSGASFDVNDWQILTMDTIYAGDRTSIDIDADNTISWISNALEWGPTLPYDMGDTFYTTDSVDEADRNTLWRVVTDVPEQAGSPTIPERFRAIRSHLQAVGGSSADLLNVENDGTLLNTGATTLDFTGEGVTASGVGGEKTINIPGTHVQEATLSSTTLRLWYTTDTTGTPDVTVDLQDLTTFPSGVFDNIADLQTGTLEDGTLVSPYTGLFFATVLNASADPEVDAGTATYVLTTLPTNPDGRTTVLADNWTRLATPGAIINEVCLARADGSQVSIGTETANALTEAQGDVRYLRVDDNNSTQTIADANAEQARRNLGITSQGGAENFRGLSDVQFEGAVNNWSEPTFNGMELSQANYSDYSTDYTTNTNTLRFGIESDTNFQLSELVQDFTVGTPLRIIGSTNPNFPDTTNLYGTVTSAQAVQRGGNFPAQLFLRVQFPDATAQPQQRGAWASSNEYMIGDVVLFSGNYFRALIDISTGGSSPTNDGTTWHQIPADVDTALGARFASTTIPASGGVSWFLAQGQYQLGIRTSSAQQDAFTRGLVENLEVRSTRTTNHRFIVYRDEDQEVEVIGTPDMAAFLQDEPTGELSVSTQFPANTGNADFRNTDTGTRNGLPRNNQVPTVAGLDHYVYNRPVFTEIDTLPTRTVTTDHPDGIREFSGWHVNVTVGNQSGVTFQEHDPGLYRWVPTDSAIADNLLRSTGDYVRYEGIGAINSNFNPTSSTLSPIGRIEFSGNNLLFTSDTGTTRTFTGGGGASSFSELTGDIALDQLPTHAGGNAGQVLRTTAAANGWEIGPQTGTTGSNVDVNISGSTFTTLDRINFTSNRTLQFRNEDGSTRNLEPYSITDLSEIPNSYGPHGQILAVNLARNGMEFIENDTASDLVTDFINVGGISTTAVYSGLGTNFTTVTIPGTGFNAAHRDLVRVGALIAASVNGPWARITSTSISTSDGTGSFQVAGDWSSVLASITNFHLAIDIAHTRTEFRASDALGYQPLHRVDFVDNTLQFQDGQGNNRSFSGGNPTQIRQNTNDIHVLQQEVRQIEQGGGSFENHAGHSWHYYTAEANTDASGRNRQSFSTAISGNIQRGHRVFSADIDQAIRDAGASAEVNNMNFMIVSAYDATTGGNHIATWHVEFDNEWLLVDSAPQTISYTGIQSIVARGYSARQTPRSYNPGLAPNEVAFFPEDPADLDGIRSAFTQGEERIVFTMDDGTTVNRVITSISANVTEEGATYVRVDTGSARGSVGVNTAMSILTPESNSSNTLTLTSPDGTQTATLSLDNTGALRIVGANMVVAQDFVNDPTPGS